MASSNNPNGFNGAHGRGLALRREASGLTQHRLSELAGLSVSTLRRIERGTQVRDENVVAVTTALVACSVLDELARKAPLAIEASRTEAS
jgi:transcriptional regulator with XRE-family HTH domain